MMQSVKIWLSNNFFMKDLDEASYILGIKIFRDRSKRMLSLSQSQYIDFILKRFNMEASSRGYLPASHGICLSKKMYPKTLEERKRMNEIPYASAMGSIMYAILCSRLDVAYTLGVASSFQTDPGEDHRKADDSKSISGYIFILNDGTVSWKSFKQQIIFDSITEAEYILLVKPLRKLSR